MEVYECQVSYTCKPWMNRDDRVIIRPKNKKRNQAKLKWKSKSKWNQDQAQDRDIYGLPFISYTLLYKRPLKKRVSSSLQSDRD